MEGKDIRQFESPKDESVYNTFSPGGCSDDKRNREMTFEAFENFENRAEKIELFNLRPYWPTPDEIDTFKKKLPVKQMALFLNWLLEMNGEPESESQRDSFSAMHHFINEHIILTDTGDNI